MWLSDLNIAKRRHQVTNSEETVIALFYFTLLRALCQLIVRGTKVSSQDSPPILLPPPSPSRAENHWNTRTPTHRKNAAPSHVTGILLLLMSSRGVDVGELGNILSTQHLSPLTRATSLCVTIIGGSSA
ncbi:hypothetical protein E2C01_096276 [Portunus trituberculatus]|uniref:Uncharacterized protein n=1 Tax=Portunus trituberculatus TaxID=210409 RepID=A0A5B7K2L2_PORTR|nr:hypothetical protein [Portunus trituberculatus]